MTELRDAVRTLAALALLMSSCSHASHDGATTSRAPQASTGGGTEASSHEESGDEPAALADTPAEREGGEVEPPCRSWPSDPNDPRVGIYIFERPRVPSDSGGEHAILFFDGVSIMTFFADVSSRDVERTHCTYSQPPQIVEHVRSGVGHRYRAHVDADGWLFVLEACHGWSVSGRFVGDHFETRYSILRRLPEGAMEELYREYPEPRYLDALFRCREVYESRTQPIPPLPAPPDDWPRRRRTSRRELGR